MSEVLDLLGEAIKPIASEIVENIPQSVKEFAHDATEALTNDINSVGGTVMANVNLVKSVGRGERVNLVKTLGAHITKFCLALDWDVKEDYDVDCDVSVVLLGEDGKVIRNITTEDRPNCFVYYNNESVQGVMSYGDDLDGSGDVDTPTGSDEQIDIDLSNVRGDVARIIVVASTHSQNSDNSEGKPMPFGQAAKPRLTLCDNTDVANPKPVLKFELDEDYSVATCVELAELYRRNGEWIYTSTGDMIGKRGFGLNAVLEKFKIKM